MVVRMETGAATSSEVCEVFSRRTSSLQPQPPATGCCAWPSQQDLSRGLGDERRYRCANCGAELISNDATGRARKWTNGNAQ